MSGTRFARTGRIRFLLCFVAICLTLAMIAIFHSSQKQLDESRDLQIRCEKEQEAVNMQLQTMIEQKHNLEKSHEKERNEDMETRRNLEHKIKTLSEELSKEQVEAKMHYEKLEKKYEQLETECSGSKRESAAEKENIEKTLELTRIELKDTKTILENEVIQWEKKYENIVKEKEHLTTQLKNMETTIAEYKSHCEYKPAFAQQSQQQEQQMQQINKPPGPPRETTRNSKKIDLEKPRNEKSFSAQVAVSSGFYHIPINSTNPSKVDYSISTAAQTTLDAIIEKNIMPSVKSTFSATGDGSKLGAVAIAEVASLNFDKIKQLMPYSSRSNQNSNKKSEAQSLILNSVENFQVFPKPANAKTSDETETQLKQQLSSKENLKKLASSTATSKLAEQNVLEANAHLKPALNAISSSSPSSPALPPLAQPPNQRKLPEMVAPVPDDAFQRLVRDDNEHAEADKNLKLPNAAADDIDAAVEELPKNENENNRYANVHGAAEHKKKSDIAEDSGAHEIKDHDILNDQNFNLPLGDDSMFGKQLADNSHDADANKKRNRDEDEEDDLGGGRAAPEDIAVKNDNHLLDEDNINNELAGDQGKDFAEGLHLEDANDEDEDVDDYNMEARQKGEQAVRN